METLAEVGKQVPALFLLGLLTWWFLRSNKDTSKHFTDTLMSIETTRAKKDAEMIDVLRKLEGAIRDNGRNLKEVLKQLSNNV